MKAIVTIAELQHRLATYEDMKAYKELYFLLSPGLCRFSYSLIKSSEAAEEIVSDVFIKLWEMRGKLAEIENLRVYLYIITKNFSLNYISRNSKNPVVSLDKIDVEAIVSTRGPEELCISSDMLRQIQAVIKQLPPQCRLVFQLVREDGIKYKEAADILGISPLTVRNQLAIAIRKIGESMPSFLVEDYQLKNRFSHS